MSSKPILLEQNPKEADYEDYISAYLQAGGLYVEKNIIYRGKAELLELDIITSNFREDQVIKHLIEIKSGKWGFNELFKVKGWLVYLNFDDGVFVAKNKRESQDYFKEKAAELNIDLIDNSNLENTEDNLNEYIIQKTEERDIQTIRYAYMLERKLIKRIKILKRRYKEYECYPKLDDYFYKINSGSFFSSNPVRRIKQLFQAYIKYKNITAKIWHELQNGKYNDDITELNRDGFKSCFYECENNILQAALYIEHQARVTIISSCIQHLIAKHKSDYSSSSFKEKIEYLSLPETIKTGLQLIVREPYFHRYPVFWQFFTYTLGGFILEDFKLKEYEYLSKKSGVPLEEIDNAFDCYNKLFPKNGGWMHKLPYSNIIMHRFFPPSFSGIGANHRRYMHLHKDDLEYENLSSKLSGGNTSKDLYKWNNLSYEILK